MSTVANIRGGGGGQFLREFKDEYRVLLRIFASGFTAIFLVPDTAAGPLCDVISCRVCRVRRLGRMFVAPISWAMFGGRGSTGLEGGEAGRACALNAADSSALTSPWHGGRMAP